MRTPNITLLHETISLCFDEALTTLGERTKRVIYDYLRRRGISQQDVFSRFADVEDLLIELYGQGGRSVMIGTLAKLCDEYSVPLNLGYSDSLGNRIAQLTEKILMQKLVPRHFQKDVDTRMFEDKTGSSAGLDRVIIGKRFRSKAQAVRIFDTRVGSSRYVSEAMALGPWASWHLSGLG